MKSHAKQLLSICFLLGFTTLAMAQPGWNWGDSVDRAKTENALYTDFMKTENFEKSAEHLEWLLENTPDLNKSIYINGANIYEALGDKQTDDAAKISYYEKALSMYDLRIQYFGDEADVLNRKALNAYKYFKGERSKYAELKELFDKTFEVNGAGIYSSNLTAYMDVVRRYKKTGGDMTDEDVFDIYFNITDVIDEQRAEAGADTDRIDKVAEYVDKLLLATVDVDCAFVEEKLGPKFRETKDVKLAKKIFGLMLSQKCTDSPLAVEAAEVINTTEPTFGVSKFIAQKYGVEGNYDKAKENFEKAIELTDDAEKKADVYLSLGKLYNAKGDKVTARSFARKALGESPSFSDAYKFIGDLYMNSYNDCKEGQSKVADRGVFLAAYDMYRKAGDSASMANAKGQFPSITEIFSDNLKEGDPLQVGCWINVSVTIERRPE